MADMHERKSVMAKHADAFIALPGEFPSISFTNKQRICFQDSWNDFVLGGYGTMEELLEMITWSQLGIHEKPVSWCLLPTS